MPSAEPSARIPAYYIKKNDVISYPLLKKTQTNGHIVKLYLNLEEIIVRSFCSLRCHFVENFTKSSVFPKLSFQILSPKMLALEPAVGD